jgi:hypothetical protein
LYNQEITMGERLRAVGLSIALGAGLGAVHGSVHDQVLLPNGTQLFPRNGEEGWTLDTAQE